jgi:hypothetical protein
MVSALSNMASGDFRKLLNADFRRLPGVRLSAVCTN